MAEGWLKSFSTDIDVHSAGTFPASRVSSKAIAVMREAGIDISSQTPKSVDQFISRDFDFVITVCDDAKEKCPVFTGRAGKRVHMGFEDPTNAVGSEAEVMEAFRKVRDEIGARFLVFRQHELRSVNP